MRFPVGEEMDRWIAEHVLAWSGEEYETYLGGFHPTHVLSDAINTLERTGCTFTIKRICKGYVWVYSCSVGKFSRVSLELPEAICNALWSCYTEEGNVHECQ